MILCIVGPSCVGKTTTGEYIKDLTKLPMIEASDYVRNRYKISKDLRPLMDFVIHEFSSKGMDTFVSDMVGDLRSSLEGAGAVILCGFRAHEEVEYLKTKLEDVFCVGIFADSQTRFKRNFVRDGNNAIRSYAEFISKDFIEYTFGISKILSEEAEFVIVNEGTFNDLYEEIDSKIIQEYLEGYFPR